MKTDLSSLLKQPRFQIPDGWDWSYRTLRGMKIRYGQVRARKKYRAVCVLFEGLGDFAEQYFELVRDLDARDLKLIVIDSPGQGGSSHYLPNTHKRHSAGFNELLEDLHVIVDEVALSAAVDMDDNHKRLPLILMGHSMGGHLALRYLAEYNKSSRGLNIFSAAAIVSPMVAIKAIEAFPPLLGPLIVRLLALRPESYVPTGCDWYEGYRSRLGYEYIFSTDPERGNLQQAYFMDPSYQHLVVGSPTCKWLLDAMNSCNILNKPHYLENIDIPVLVGLAEKELLVSNKAIRKATKCIPHAELLTVSGAHHEILMETDDCRNQFLDRFFTFVDENVLMRPDNGKIHIQ